MSAPSLLVLYVPSLDRRRLSPEVTPFLSAALAEHPVVELETHPSVELLPSLATGVWPHEHRVWQVRMKPPAPRSLMDRAWDAVPHRWSTALQSLRHWWDPSFDLPTVEPRRRRRFAFHRLKMLRRQGGGLQEIQFGGMASIFTALPGQARHRTLFSLKQAPGGLASWIDGRVRLDLIEFYALDLFSHWNLDRPDAMRRMLARTDALLSDAVARASSLGLRTLLVVDHGQEPVLRTIDLPLLLRSSGVPPDEYSYFTEITNARLWYFTERARGRLRALLGQLPDASYLDNEGMARFNVAFRDEDGFGDAYLIANPGAIFFPHDFHHPLVNFYMSLTTAEQASRRRSPVHRGAHGYLPGSPSEHGYLVALDHGLAPRVTQAQLIDVAPTLLNLLGASVPSSMRGQPIYT